MNSENMRRHRAQRVRRGLCGACGKKRGALAWLCDSCAELHRVKQRSVVCPHCNGLGAHPGPIVCCICGGDGRLTRAAAVAAAKEFGFQLEQAS
jgi:hypothetical protein